MPCPEPRGGNMRRRDFAEVPTVIAPQARAKMLFARSQGRTDYDSYTHFNLVDSIADVRCDDVCVRAKSNAAPTAGEISCYVIDKTGRRFEMDQTAVVRSGGKMVQGKGKMDRLPNAGS